MVEKHWDMILSNYTLTCQACKLSSSETFSCPWVLAFAWRSPSRIWARALRCCVCKIRQRDFSILPLFLFRWRALPLSLWWSPRTCCSCVLWTDEQHVKQQRHAQVHTHTHSIRSGNGFAFQTCLCMSISKIYVWCLWSMYLLSAWLIESISFFHW